MLRRLKAIFYYASGSNGPQVFMVDDCRAEQAAIESIYPSAAINLCTFHILHACWRWLWEGKHNVTALDRKECYECFQRLVYMTNPTRLEQE